DSAASSALSTGGSCENALRPSRIPGPTSFTRGGDPMRRMIALSTSVLAASLLIAGLAIAQDEESAGETGETAGETGETTGETGETGETTGETPEIATGTEAAETGVGAAGTGDTLAATGTEE